MKKDTSLKMNPQLDDYFSSLKQWQDELQQLRKIVLGCGLTEELKWGGPCYTFQKRNVVILGGFKESCVLSFFKGALLKDPHGILVKPGENTQAARVIRFTSLQEITKLASVIDAYLHDALEVEQAGLKVDFGKSTELEIPSELQNKFSEHPELEAAFDALTPGRQRAYIMFFTAAKQSTTRSTRIEKYMPQILAGKGMNDCDCGHSKKMPACDGSHKDYE